MRYPSYFFGSRREILDSAIRVYCIIPLGFLLPLFKIIFKLRYSVCLQEQCCSHCSHPDLHPKFFMFILAFYKTVKIFLQVFSGILRNYEVAFLRLIQHRVRAQIHYVNIILCTPVHDIPLIVLDVCQRRNMNICPQMKYP